MDLRWPLRAAVNFSSSESLTSSKSTSKEPVTGRSAVLEGRSSVL